MSRKPKICVVGSINMDLVTTTDKMPDQGETVMGKTFATYPGGKGANQAVAASKLGAEVTMIGAIGDDAFGHTLLAHFENEGILIQGIKTCQHRSTGIATIILSDHDNRIIVSAGANEEVVPEWVEQNKEAILNCDLVLLQFEIPMKTIQYTTKLAHDNGIPIVINPAPFQEFPGEMLHQSTYFTPNEIELLSMNQMADIDHVREKMIVTKGSQGIQLMDEQGQIHQIPAFDVKVEDTTGAGDTFNGAFAQELAQGVSINEAACFANAAAALSVTKLGAQGGMPTRQEVELFLKEQDQQS